MDKRALRDQVLASLRREIDVVLAAASSTREGATHEENRAEHAKDTRAIEASYLAGAQAERVAELRRDLAALVTMAVRAFDGEVPIGLSALVTLETDGVRSEVFLVPNGGGVRCEFQGRTIQLVTPKSPLGAALVGKCVGEIAEVATPGGVRESEIVGVE